MNKNSVCLGGDMATTRRYLEMASRASSTLPHDDMPITPININCLDPLGRSALLIGTMIFRHMKKRIIFFFSLLIAIEYENSEMIELLLNCNVDTGEALLHAIDEEFVEGRKKNGGR